MKHIFIKQVLKDNVIIKKEMYNKEGILLNIENHLVGLSNEEEKNNFFKYFFDREDTFFQSLNNEFYSAIIYYNEESWEYNHDDLISCCESKLYGKLNIDYDDLKCPISIYNDSKSYVLRFRYDDFRNLIYYNENDEHIYKIQYVFYEDIYDLLDVQMIF